MPARAREGPLYLPYVHPVRYSLNVVHRHIFHSSTCLCLYVELSVVGIAKHKQMCRGKGAYESNGLKIDCAVAYCSA